MTNQIKFIWGRKETTFPYVRIPIKKWRRNEGKRNSPLEYHSNHCCRKDPQTNAEISGQNFKEKQDIGIA